MFLPPIIEHYFQPPSLVAQVAAKQNDRNVSSSNWMPWINSVRNEQIEFEARWVIIRDGIRDDGSGYGLIKTVKGSETGLNNPRYGIVQVSYPVLPDKPPPMPLGPPPGMTTDSILRPEVRIFIIYSSKIYRLSYSNDQRVLDVLLSLLDDPDRGWAAYITLSKMMGINGLSSKINQITPNKWWELEGKTQKAKQEWMQYIQKVKPSMIWSPVGGYYKHRAPDGRFVL
jgi:hypothetical protein